MQQIPQRSIIGSNFALTNRTEVLAAASATAKISTRPSSPSRRMSPSRLSMGKTTTSKSAATVVRLAPGTQMHLMETANGWTLIAEDEQKLGYVQTIAIVGLQ